MRGRDPRIDFSRRHRDTRKERKETKIETEVVDECGRKCPGPGATSDGPILSLCLRASVSTIYVASRSTEQEDARVRGRDPRIDFSRRHRDTERKETKVETEVVDNTVVNALAPGLLLTDPFFLCVSVHP